MADKACPMKKTSIGGQALIEGVMMRGPQRTAMAVRHTSGEIRMEEWDNPVAKQPWLRKAPFIRGIFNYVDSMMMGTKCLMRSAEISGLEDLVEESPKKKKKRESERESFIFSVMEKSMKKALDAALDDLLKDWK